MNKTAIPDINQWIANLRANIPAQLIQTPPQMAMTKNAAPSGWGSTLEKQLEMKVMAHRTWNKRQAKLSSSSREIKAITQSLRSFEKSQRVREFNPQRLEAITIQQFSTLGNGRQHQQ
ncbi:MAG: hypothetical protein EZS28_032121 [Streblomastix strix]|uniref:Uncharacterized protein n=1 Tax=Streblomastix strix TaxID=222440 RepID=A0A5J4UQJ4_9EUKA|nr:MAG: hypothetical protein EZS28_032121 [Streblomastix strix]